MAGLAPWCPGCDLLPLPAASGLLLFFQGWNPLPTAASASGGGDMDAVLLHSAAIMARGVPRRPGGSWERGTGVNYTLPGCDWVGGGGGRGVLANHRLSADHWW